MPSTAPPAESEPAQPIKVGEPFESSLGTWVWTEVDGDASTIPAHGIQLRPTGGYIAVEGDRTWTSADGLTWSFTGDVGNADVWISTFTVGDSEWRRHSSATGQVVERLVDDQWLPVAIPEPAPPPVAGVTWGHPWYGDAAGLADSIVMPVTMSGWVDFTEYYGTFPDPDREGEVRPPRSEWDPVSETIRLRDWWRSDNVVAVLEVRIMAGTPDVIEFVDVDTGDMVAVVESTLPGVSSEELRERLAWGGVVYPSLVVRARLNCCRALLLRWSFRQNPGLARP